MRKADIINVDVKDALLLASQVYNTTHYNLQKFNKVLKELLMLVSDGKEVQSYCFFTFVLAWDFNNFSPLNLV